MAEMSDYCENLVLNHTLGYSDIGSFVSQMYLALHTADPTDAGSGTEVDVARQAISFATASGTSGSVASTDAQSFTSMPSGETVTHIGIWDHLSAGNLLFHTGVTASKAVASGDTITVAAAAITITLARWLITMVRVRGARVVAALKRRH